MKGDSDSDIDPDPVPVLPSGLFTSEEKVEYERNMTAWIRRNPQRWQRIPTTEREKLALDLETWWMEKADDEIHRTVPKAVEYGAGDLEAIGRDMRMTGTSTAGETPDDELGVYFYLVGKMARWRSAIERGERVSDDTLFDIGVYVRMAQRIRTHGGWPGTPLPDLEFKYSEDKA